MSGRNQPPPEPVKTPKDLQFLGLRVRDRITGFSGVVSSVCFDLYGCIQGAVTPPVDEKGVVADGRWLDLTRLEVVDHEPVMEVPGGLFTVDRSPQRQVVSSMAHGPAEKPYR